MRDDDLGTRLKQYESITTNTMLMPNTPVYARIDGRAFHTFCRGLQKPFCMPLVQIMQEVCRYLVEQTNAKLGYVQSDEISLCWDSPDKAPFKGKLFKMQSVLAGMASSRFAIYALENCIDEEITNNSDYGTPSDYYNEWVEIHDKLYKHMPHFDCRVFQVPNEMELANCFIWRELDAVRNSVSMLAQANFSHKSLQGLNSKQLQNKLLIEKDINWNDLQDDLKRGAYFKRVLYTRTLTDEEWNKIPDNQKPESRECIRSHVVKIIFPIMKHVSNKVDVYFNDAKPVFKAEE